MKTENYINHIALVFDASSSMSGLEKELIKVADNQIAYLAQRSKDLDQETRVTVYSFNNRNQIKCLVYDKDVLRMPSISGLYHTTGMTALIDATILALDDLALTPEKYGEHAYLIYVLTDGQENDSRNPSAVLSDKIIKLPDHWTIATFVPDQNGVFEAKKFGFPKENIAVWDATTAKGVSEAGEKIKQTTEQFMQNRTKGIRGTKNLFTLNTPTLSTVMGLDILSKSKLEYHAGYSGIHALRYLSYKICGGEMTYPEFMDHRDEARYDWPYFVHLLRFPNLNWHSDCEGTYTKTGRIDAFVEPKRDLMTGNSIKLLKELEEIGKYKDRFANEVRGWEIYDRFYYLIKDVVENYDGKITFC